MPLFFLISGFLYSLTNADFLKIPTLKFIKKKTIRLLVPYLVLGVILFAIKFAFSGLSHASRSFSVTAFFAMFVNTGYPSSTMGYLWYVFTLFVIFFLVSILALLRINLKDTRISLLLALGFWCLSYSCHITGWANLSSVCRYIPYFLLGIAFEGKYEKIMQSISRGGVYHIDNNSVIQYHSNCGQDSSSSICAGTCQSLNRCNNECLACHYSSKVGMDKK